MVSVDSPVVNREGITAGVVNMDWQDSGVAKPKAVDLNWLDPDEVFSVVSKVEPAKAMKSSYIDNICRLVKFYPNGDLGLALLRVRMMVGDINPVIPTKKTDREIELVKICTEASTLKLNISSRSDPPRSSLAPRSFHLGPGDLR